MNTTERRNHLRIAILFAAALMLACAAFTGTALAAEGDGDGTSLDTGFYMRLNLGAGFARTGYNPDGGGDFTGSDRLHLQGGALSYGASAGFLILPGLAVHADYRGWWAVSPDARYEGEKIGEIDDLSLTMHNFGGGVTIHPGNRGFFISAMVGPAMLKYKYENDFVSTSGNTRDDNRWGLGSEIGLGYTALVKDGLGIGAGAFGSGHWIKGTDDAEGSLSGFQLGVRFVMIFN